MSLRGLDSWIEENTKCLLAADVVMVIEESNLLASSFDDQAKQYGEEDRGMLLLGLNRSWQL